MCLKMYPSKVTSFNKSIFPKYVTLIKLIQVKSWRLNDLWHECSFEFVNLTEFVQTLTDLYALNLIDLKAKEVHWVAETN